MSDEYEWIDAVAHDYGYPIKVRIRRYVPPRARDIAKNWPIKLPNIPKIVFPSMNGREEKLTRIKAQIARAVSEISHGDHSAVESALADALNSMLHFLEEEVPDRLSFVPGSPEVKEMQRQAEEVEQKKQVREALDTLRSEPTKIKRR
jgi:hypothetical protein